MRVVCVIECGEDLRVVIMKRSVHSEMHVASRVCAGIERLVELLEHVRQRHTDSDDAEYMLLSPFDGLLLRAWCVMLCAIAIV